MNARALTSSLFDLPKYSKSDCIDRVMFTDVLLKLEAGVDMFYAAW